MHERKVIRNPYYRAAGWGGGIGLALTALAGTLAVILSQDHYKGKSREGVTAVAMVAGILGLALLGSAVLFLYMARAVNRFIREIRDGKCVLHWTYTPAEWQAFQAAETPLLKRDFRQIVWFPLLIGLPLGFGAFAILAYTDKRGGGSFPVVAAGTAGFLLLVAGLAYYFRVVRRRAWGRRCLLNPPDSYLHLEFAHANGEFLSFNGFNQTLIGVELLDSEPASLEFTILSTNPKTGEMRETKRMLVPTGGREKAAESVAKLRQAWRLA